MISKTSISILLLMLCVPRLWADSLYVTDRILLGVHESASKDSPLLQSVPSGTSLEILAENNGFKEVRLPNGAQGWVDAAFLVSEQPAPAQYDILLAQHKQTQAALATVQKKLKKTARELQVREDEVSNANTTIQGLKKKIRSKQPTANAVKDELKLKSAEAEIEKLNAKISQFSSQEQAKMDASTEQENLVRAEKELGNLRARINIALRSLQGKDPISAKEIASEPPGLPAWFWGVMMLFLIAGLTAGIAVMDYRNRRRHGGFRI